jgi:hypothetical protein
MACKKCELLMELYKHCEQSPRNYWVMTELFVMLHLGDVCEAAQQLGAVDRASSRPENSDPGTQVSGEAWHRLSLPPCH